MIILAMELKEICPRFSFTTVVISRYRSSTRLRCQIIYVSWFSFMAPVVVAIWYIYCVREKETERLRAAANWRGTCIQIDTPVCCLPKWCHWPILSYKHRNLIKSQVIFLRLFLFIAQILSARRHALPPHLLFNLIMNFRVCAYFTPSFSICFDVLCLVRGFFLLLYIDILIIRDGTYRSKCLFLQLTSVALLDRHTIYKYKNLWTVHRWW